LKDSGILVGHSGRPAVQRHHPESEACYETCHYF
jgi:hypothetical protein